MSKACDKLTEQLIRFLIVGAGVFIVQAGLVEGADQFVGPVWAQILVFPFAVTLAWLGNRHFTFKASTQSARQQWLRYVLANGLGWTISNVIYFTLILTSSVLNQHPMIAVAAGTAGGLIFNFSASRHYIFNK